MTADCPGLQGNVFAAECPSRQILESLAEKWTLLVVHALMQSPLQSPLRTAELRRAVGGISEKMLIQTLRKLERNGFVHRRAYAQVPPRVEYSLTDLGRSLAGMVLSFDTWVESNFAQVHAAQQAFDARAAGEADRSGDSAAA